MTPRLFSLALVLTGIVALAGSALIVGGLWLGISTAAIANMKLSTPANPGGVSPSSNLLSVGATAPDFTLASLDQQVERLSQFHGKVVVLNFWATWCGPCSAEMPNIEKVYQSLSHEAVIILAVDQGDFADQVKGYADLYQLHFPILLDDHSQVGQLYRVQALPTTLFIDRDGIIREIHIGGPMSEDFIRAHIQSLLQRSQ
jgi:peroxiredoxin